MSPKLVKERLSCQFGFQRMHIRKVGAWRAAAPTGTAPLKASLSYRRRGAGAARCSMYINSTRSARTAAGTEALQHAEAAVPLHLPDMYVYTQQ